MRTVHMNPVTLLIEWYKKGVAHSGSQSLLIDYFNSIKMATARKVKIGSDLDAGAVMENFEELLDDSISVDVARQLEFYLEDFKNALGEFLLPLQDGSDTEISRAITEKFLAEHNPDPSVSHRVPNYVQEALGSAANKIFAFHELLSSKVQKKSQDFSQAFDELDLSEGSESSCSWSSQTSSSIVEQNPSVKFDKTVIGKALTEVFYEQVHEYILRNILRLTPRKMTPDEKKAASAPSLETPSRRQKLFTGTALPARAKRTIKKFTGRSKKAAGEDDFKIEISDLTLRSELGFGKNPTKTGEAEQGAASAEVDISKITFSAKNAEAEQLIPKGSPKKPGILGVNEKWKSLSKPKKGGFITLFVLLGIALPFSTLIGLCIYRGLLSRAEKQMPQNAEQKPAENARAPLNVKPVGLKI